MIHSIGAMRMKTMFSRMFALLVLLTVLAAALPVAVFAEDLCPVPGANFPWWEICPPTPPKPRTRVVTRIAETVVEQMAATGYCYTAIKQVNVRSQPSTYATRVATIRSAGTEFTVNARVKNSSGEIWYAVILANSTLGYIRSDLLNTDHVILLEDPYSYESEIPSHPTAASESGSDVLNVAVPPKPQATPQVIYIPAQPSDVPTPTPIIVYVTPEPPAQPEITPQVIYVNPESNQG